jgi:hypothetical protein
MASARAQAITIAACGREFDAPEGSNSDNAPDGPNKALVDFAALADWHEPEAGSGSDKDAAKVIPLSPGHYVVTKNTVECLKNDWVPGGARVDTSGIEIGAPEALLMAFAKVEKSRGEHFDASSTLIGGLAGVAIGGLIAFRIALLEERELEREEGEAEAANEEDEEIRRRGIYDWEAEPDSAA